LNGRESISLQDEIVVGLEAGALEVPVRASAHRACARSLQGAQAIQGGTEEAGVREVRFHDLCHTFGTRMAGVGVPMRTLQEWLGHRDAKTTAIYADYSPSEREREWVESAFARATSRATKPSETERAEID
jgi:integrase